MQFKTLQLKTLLLSFTLALLPISSMAGSGHDHGNDHGDDHGHSHSQTAVNQITAQANATEIVAALVKRNKLENSWSTITASSIEKITVQGNSEWRVVFVNEKMSEPDKQKLYVFLTLGGDYIATNFTGK